MSSDCYQLALVYGAPVLVILAVMIGVIMGTWSYHYKRRDRTCPVCRAKTEP